VSIFASVIDIESATEHSSESSEGDDHGACKLETNPKPTIGREIEEIGLLVLVQEEVALLSESLFVTIGSDCGQAIQGLREERVDGAATNGIETSELARGLDEILLGLVVEKGDGSEWGE
jgi:hypothetical protein